MAGGKNKRLIDEFAKKMARYEEELEIYKDAKKKASDAVQAGQTLSLWFAQEARRIYATLSETPEERDIRRLIEFIRGRGGELTAKQLQQSNSRKYPTAEHALAALDALANDGFGEWHDRPTTDKGGRPTRVFVLHGAPDETDETQQDHEDGAQ